MATLSQSQRFDSGIQSTKRLDPNASVFFVKGDTTQDPFAVKPVKSLEQINTDTDKDIRAIGNTDFGIVGVGAGLTDWWIPEATTRWRVSYTNYTYFHYYFDLSQLPASFWNAVTQESDIHVITQSTGVAQDFFIQNFDLAGNTGVIVTESTDFDIYVYTDAASVQSSTIASDADYYFPYDGNAQTFSNREIVNIDVDASTYSTGVIGEALNDNVQYDRQLLTGFDAHVTFFFKVNTGNTGDRIFMTIGDALRLSIRGTSSNDLYLDYIKVSNGTDRTNYVLDNTNFDDSLWHVCSLYFNTKDGTPNQFLDVYVDGSKVVDELSLNDGPFGIDSSTFVLANFIQIDELIIHKDDLDFDPLYHTTINGIRNDTGYGQSYTEQTFSGVSPSTYGGLQVYTLDSNNNWSSDVNGKVIKSSSIYPEYGPVFNTNTAYLYFVSSNRVSDSTTRYISKYSFATNTLTENFVSQVISDPTQKHRSIRLPITEVEFVAHNNDIDAFGISSENPLTLDPGRVVSNVFTAGDDIYDMCLYGRYFGYAYKDKTKAVAPVWDIDFTNTSPISGGIIGNGRPTIIHDFSGAFVQLVTQLELDQPLISLRQTVGGTYDTIVDIPITLSGFDYQAKYRGDTVSFNNDVAPHKTEVTNGVVFWGNFTHEGIARKGVFLIGRNAITKVISISYLLELDAEPVEIFRTDDGVYVLDEAGNVWAQGSNFDSTEVITMEVTAGSRAVNKMANTIEIGCEQLTGSQTVTVYAKTIADSDFSTQIAQFTTSSQTKNNAGRTNPDLTTFQTVHKTSTSAVQYRVVGAGGVTLTSVKVNGQVNQ